MVQGGGGNQLPPFFKPIFPTPLRIHGSNGAITRATLEAISWHNTITKLMLGLSIGFQNGMTWAHSTKTHKLVWVLGNGPFPDQVPSGGALRLLSLANLENFSLFHVVDQKLFHFYFQTDTHTFCIPIWMGKIFSKWKYIPFTTQRSFICFILFVKANTN